MQTLDVLYLSAWAVDISSPCPRAFVRFLSGMSAHSAHERFPLSIINDSASLYLSMPRARAGSGLGRLGSLPICSRDFLSHSLTSFEFSSIILVYRPNLGHVFSPKIVAHSLRLAHTHWRDVIHFKANSDHLEGPHRARPHLLALEPCVLNETAPIPHSTSRARQPRVLAAPG